MAEREKPIEIINPPNMLRVKVGGRLPAADPEAIARAEKALEQLSGQFGDWLGQEVDKLEAALARTKTETLEGEAGDGLFTVAHDLRGLGTTYEFPLVTRIAASLARLIETPEKRSGVPLSLAEAHVHTIRAALNQNIRSSDDPVGAQLAEELETRVVALVGEPT